MRKLLAICALLAISFSSLSYADAADRRTGFFAPQTNNRRTYRTWRGGIFDRMLEMERRKNEIIFWRVQAVARVRSPFPTPTAENQAAIDFASMAAFFVLITQLLAVSSVRAYQLKRGC